MSDPNSKDKKDKPKESYVMDEAEQIARARELGWVRYFLEKNQAWEEGYQEGLELGREEARQMETGRIEGRKEGRKEGFEAGIQKGLAAGAEQAQVAMIRNLMTSGMSLEQIASALKIEMAEINRLLADK